MEQKKNYTIPETFVMTLETESSTMVYPSNHLPDATWQPETEI